MARSNVGTPRFYVDYMQYWKAMGILGGIGPYDDNSENFHNQSDVVIGMGSYRPSLIGFDPSNYMNDLRNPQQYSADTLLFNHLVILNQRVYLPKSGKLWIGCLNHNMLDNECSMWNLSAGKSISYNEWNTTGYGYGSNPNFNTDYKETEPIYGGMDNTATYNEIVNFNQPTMGPIHYNGFSIIEIVGGNVSGLNQFSINDIPSDNIYDTTLEMSGAPTPSEVGPMGAGFDHIHFSMETDSTDDQMRFIMGSFNFGGIYDMPHSPDLSLTMTREYDGVDSYQSMSGRKFSNIRYAGPPNWRNDLPAWSLSKQPTNFLKKNKSLSSRGRRIWNLQFSYIDSNDLFPVNEGSTPYNPTDSSHNSDGTYNSGYVDADFSINTGTPLWDGDVDNEFSSHLGMDDSFIGVVMDKTIGGTLPFIFQPDSNNNSPDQFAICEIDQDSISFELVANNVYNVSLKIREVW